MTVPGPGWYPDPSGGPQVRWWNGTTWAEPPQSSPGEFAPVGALVPPVYASAATEYVPMARRPVAAQLPQPAANSRMTRKQKDRELRRNNPMAYTGIVLALVGFIFNPFAIPSILGIVFSSIGLAKSFALTGLGSRAAGRVIAAIGMILGILGVVLFALAIGRALT